MSITLPDTSIYSQIKTPDIIGSAKQIQDFQQQAALDPVIQQQAQANVAATQAGTQSTLTQTEANKLALEQKAKQNEFLKWADQTPPVRNEDGSVNQAATLKNMYDAGYGRFAIEHVAAQLDADIKNAQTQQELISVVTKAAQSYAQMHQGESAEKKAAASKEADMYAKQKYGRSFSDVLGPDWMTAALKAPLGMTAYNAEQRTQIATYTDAEARNPNSDVNKKWKMYAASRAPELANLTLYDAMRIPGATDVINSFNINAGTRTEAFKEVTERGANIDKMTALRDSLSSRLATWKPGELFSAYYKRITNSPEQADVEQLVQELKQYGIDLNLLTNPKGAVNALNRQINAEGAKQEGAKKLTSTPSLNVPAQTQSTISSRPIETWVYSTKDGTKKTATLDPADPKYESTLYVLKRQEQRGMAKRVQ